VFVIFDPYAVKISAMVLRGRGSRETTLLPGGKKIMKHKMNNEFSSYLSAERLYGDDFTIEEIQQWFVDEAEGYANLGAKEKDRYHYVYHQLNLYHAFRFIHKMHFDEALGIGSAYGDEFKPIAPNINKITILDPSDAFSEVSDIFGTPSKYSKPTPNGDMLFENNQFGLVTSLGVMHHIPNVSHVMGECYRCLHSGGIMLLREPIISMGDWSKPRTGLTKRERGIPLKILDNIVLNTGFKIKHRSLCIFPIIPKLSSKIGIAAYNSSILTIADALFSKAFSWNIKYHRIKFYEKLAPAAAFYVLEKH
jgi:SAM-dependent methyltransferase